VLDPTYVGRSYPPTAPHLVDRAQIAAFAAAIGADDPAHHDPEAARALGYSDVVAPPTFAIKLTLPAGMVAVLDTGIDFTRVVHGDQRFAHSRPIVAGDELTCLCTIEGATSRAGSDFLTLRIDVRAADGSTVCSAWTLLVSRGA
jgi:acyl dehydratase